MSIAAGLAKIDELDENSRQFYENAKLKLSYTLYFAAWAMVFLGLASQSGGKANYSAWIAKLINSLPLDDDYRQASFLREESGFGFACFVYVVAFLLAVGFAIYYSPFFQTQNEKTILLNPDNIMFRGNERPSSIQRPVAVAVATPANV